MPDELIFLRNVGIKAGMSLYFHEGTLFFVDEKDTIDRKQVRFDNRDDKIWIGKEFDRLVVLAEILATAFNLKYEVVAAGKQIRFLAP